MASHISDDDLERYAMGTLKDEAELAVLEEHRPVHRPGGKHRAYVTAMRRALKDGWARR